MSLIKKTSGSYPSLSSLWGDFLGLDFLNNNAIDLGTVMPAVNVIDEPTQYLIQVAVPGSNKADFKISVDGNILTVSASKSNENDSSGNTPKFTKKEFDYSNFSRSFQIPENVDKSKISASYDNGVLTITLPKKDASTDDNSPKQISVQ